MEDILFTLKKGNIIANFISEEGEYLVCKTRHYFGNLKTERPEYQGVVELAFFAMTLAQLLLFQLKDEGTNFVEVTTQCKNVQAQLVKLLREMEDEHEATTPTSSTEATAPTSNTQRKRKIYTECQGLGGRFNKVKMRKFGLKHSHKELYYSLQEKSTSSATNVAATSTATSEAATTSATLNHGNVTIALDATAAATAAATSAVHHRHHHHYHHQQLRHDGVLQFVSCPQVLLSSWL